MADNGTNGTIPGRIERLGQSLITALPAPFLLLVLLTGAWNAIVLWFLNDQMDSRNVLAGKIIDHCLDALTRAPH